jgi:hypothetical protein
MHSESEDQGGSDQEPVPIVFEGEGGALVIMMVDKSMEPLVRKAASGGTARVLAAWDYTNFVAVWCDLAVVDPTLMSEQEWGCLCELFGSYVDVQFKMLLVKPSPHKATLPARNVVNAPAGFTSDYLKGQMLRAGRPPKSKAVWEKKERQIVRLMYMLKCLDASELRIRDVAERFEVSPRTVQRDLEVLLMAEYPIQDASEPGTYRFPKGYKSHNAYNQ